MLKDDAAKKAAKARATKTVELSDRGACDVELLVVGGFSPLKGFMDEREYTAVVQTMRLPDGLLFGLPVVLDTDDESVKEGDVLLLTYKGQELAVMDVSSKWTPNKPVEARQCYGTTSIEHPAVQMIAMERGKFYLGGQVSGLALPKRAFPCATPAEVRAALPVGEDVLAFQCRNPIHRAHYELFTRALDASNVSKNAVCLVHPTVGPTQDDDIPGEARVRTYEVLKEEVKNPMLRWAYLPYSMHMAGPREAVQHMAIRKNYGCTHFIIGRDMAGCKSSLSGEGVYFYLFFTSSGAGSGAKKLFLISPSSGATSGAKKLSSSGAERSAAERRGFLFFRFSFFAFFFPLLSSSRHLLLPNLSEFRFRKKKTTRRRLLHPLRGPRHGPQGRPRAGHGHRPLSQHHLHRRKGLRHGRRCRERGIAPA